MHLFLLGMPFSVSHRLIYPFGGMTMAEMAFEESWKQLSLVFQNPERTLVAPRELAKNSAIFKAVLMTEIVIKVIQLATALPYSKTNPIRIDALLFGNPLEGELGDSINPLLSSGSLQKAQEDQNQRNRKKYYNRQNYRHFAQDCRFPLQFCKLDQKNFGEMSFEPKHKKK
jgi:hypothetical protein